jgi:hypothetical protein
MDEKEWLSCGDGFRMVRWLRKQRSLHGREAQRKARLVAGAACRRIWGLIEHPTLRAAVEAAEHFADGRMGEEGLAEVFDESARTWVPRLVHVREQTASAEEAALVTAASARSWASMMRGRWSPWEMLERALRAAGLAAGGGAMISGGVESPMQGGLYRIRDPDRLRVEDRAQCDLLREVFGNPFRPVALPPACLAWQGGLAPRMAADVYEQQRWGELPVLADALEEAGCADEAILVHCRGGGAHVRGCWVIDALRDRPRGKQERLFPD